MAAQLSREEVLNRLDQKVNEYLAMSGNCAQTSFLVLQEQFELEGGTILKALTPFPGICLRGETCGAVVGSLMALGLVYGRERLDDWSEFGQRYNLADSSESAEWLAAGAVEKCSAVIRKGVRIAAEILLGRAG
jgi:hypothetical protein